MSTTMSDKKILEKGVINFFYKKEEYRSLSNFYETDIVIMDGDERREYESGEHCFHGEKYTRLGVMCTNENRKNVLLEYGKKFLKGVCIYNKGSEVKKLGGTMGVKMC